MIIIYTLITLAIGLVTGYLIGRRTPNRPISPFSKVDAREGRKTIQKRIEKRKTRILERAKKHGKITNDDVEDLFCISDRTATNYLSELEEEGKLAQQGTGSAIYYTPKA